MKEKSSSIPEIVKILWYRHKVDNWPIKKISEVYNIPKSTIYRWFKSIKEKNIDENYIKFDIDKISIRDVQEYTFISENTLSREYLKSSFQTEKEIQKKEIQVNLPERYGFDYSFALPLDPYRIFIYWEINKDDSEIIIKIFDDTENEKLLHMILTSNYTISNMYVPVGIPDRVFFAEFYIKEGGNLKFVTRTNKVRTPRNSPSSDEITNMYNWYNIDQTIFSISSFIINRL